MIYLSNGLASRRRRAGLRIGAGVGFLSALLALTAAARAEEPPGGPEPSGAAVVHPEHHREGAPEAPAPFARRTGDPGPDPAAEHEAALQQIETRLAALSAGIADRVLYREALREELRQLERDIDDLARANRQLSAMAETQERALQDTVAELTAARAQLARQRGALAELLRAAHAVGRGEYLRLLLADEDLRGKSRLFGYYRVLATERAARVAQVDRLRAELATLERSGRAEAERLQRLASRQERTRLRLSNARGARAVVLRDLELALAEDRSRASALAADAEALSALIEELKRKAEIRDEIELDQSEIAERRGKLAWPLARAKVVQPFGSGRKRGALHADGILLATAPGAEVRAVHHGRVAYAEWLRGFGMLIVIDHGDGYMSLYGHNQTLLKEVGEWVATGDLIALSGNSGGAERNALYFAIRHQGRALDPGDWCAARSG